MLNSIFESIISQLREVWGDTRIYTRENIESGLNVGAFSMRIIKPMRLDKLRNLFQMTYPIVVRYFPVEGESMTELHATAEVVADVIHTLDFEGKRLPVIGKDIAYEIVDNVVHVFVTYRVDFETLQLAEEAMESIELEIKGGLDGC